MRSMWIKYCSKDRMHPGFLRPYRFLLVKMHYIFPNANEKKKKKKCDDLPFDLESNSLRKSDGDVVDDGKYFSCINALALLLATALPPFSINGLVAAVGMIEFNFKLTANGVGGEQLSFNDGCCCC